MTARNLQPARYARWAPAEKGLPPNVEQALLRVAEETSLTAAQTEMLLAIACDLSYTEVSDLRQVSRQATKQLALVLFDRLHIQSRSELAGALSRLESLAWSGHSPEVLAEFLLSRFGPRMRLKNPSAPGESRATEPAAISADAADGGGHVAFPRKRMLLAAGAVILAVSVVMLPALVPGSDDRQFAGSGLQLTELDDGRPIESGLCLARGLDQSVTSDLTARSAAGGTEEEPFASFATTFEEVRSVLAFPAVAPTVPEGWVSRVEIKPESPIDGLNGYCYLRVFLEESVAIEAVAFSGVDEPATPSDGRRMAELEVRASHPDFSPFTQTPSGPGRSVTFTKVNGADAELLLRDYDQPSVLISWQLDTIYLRLACTWMTADECLAVAATTR